MAKEVVAMTAKRGVALGHHPDRTLPYPEVVAAAKEAIAMTWIRGMVLGDLLDHIPPYLGVAMEGGTKDAASEDVQGVLTHPWIRTDASYL